MLKVMEPTSGQKSLGAFYTPKHLAVWLARHLNSFGCDPKTVLDPAAGAGALLEAAGSVFPHARLRGMDLDLDSHGLLKEFGWASGDEPCDALLIKDWFVDRTTGHRVIFSNPPWGAKVDATSAHAYRRHFQVATGSFDTFDLFVEKTIKTLQLGDWAALFLPDSLLLPNHARTRRMIQENVIIHSVTRLPEGVFPGVYMGSLAIVLQKKELPAHHSIRFSRISRFEYFSSKPTATNLEMYRLRNQVEIQQSDWIKSFAATWHGNATLQGELALPSSLINHCSHASGSNWDLWFTSGRGLEIGKKALVKGYPPVSVSSLKIPVVVGEDVNRRAVTPSRLLSLVDSKEVNLKKELLPGPRLLVRKTGIGIKAAVASDLVTTQTVYHFRAKASAPEYALHYAAGFLTSRVLIAVHLAKTGETEWRSHPYVTQKVVRDLQLPIPEPGSNEEKIAKEIASISAYLHVQDDFELEERLDLLVAEILGKGEALVAWAKTFLANIEGCSYTKHLTAEPRIKKSA